MIDRRLCDIEFICQPLLMLLMNKLPIQKLNRKGRYNGEFLAHLDSLVRYKLNQLFFLEKCLTTVNSFDKRYDSYILKPKDSVTYDVNVESSFSVKELRLTLDLLGDYGMIKHLGNELDEFINMYYSPCIAELFGTRQGSTPDVEPQYLMAHSLLTHYVYLKVSSLFDSIKNI